MEPATVHTLRSDRQTAGRTAAPSRTLPPAGPSLLARALATPDVSIRAIIERFTNEPIQIALVVDQNRRLLGTVTDGDIRRGILRGVSTEATIREIMNARPRTMRFGEPRGDVMAFMRSERIRHIPVIDFAGRAVDLITLDALLAPGTQPYPVVLMAGGKGMRLRPLTENTPKPMLDVGGRPILETIVRRLAESGFTDIRISVNYRADVIRNHFGDGSELGVALSYIEETQPLGTAGPLASLSGDIEGPVLVMNGDLLTKVDPIRMIDFHREHGGAATMAVREYEFEVPYGVVDLQGNEIRDFREKPVSRHFINAGIYVLGPDAVATIPGDRPFDMPAVFDACRAQALKTLAYPIREYWVDIGQIADYHRANDEFDTVFRAG